MATTTITRVYSTYDKAADIVRDLEAADVAHGDITLVGPRDDKAHSNVKSYGGSTGEAGEAGTVYDTAIGGGVVGGLAGLLAGIGLIAIPGVGPVVAAGWLAATLAGATIGTASGAFAETVAHSLTHHGVSHDDAHRYADAVTHGGTLVSVKIDESKRSVVESIMGLNDSAYGMGDTDATTSRRAI